MIKNTQGITQIILKPFGECKCAIGQDWYHIDFEITFIPDAFYPDYMDVSRYVSEHINGHELNIEDAIQRMWVFLKNTYNPKKLIIKGIVDNVTTHCPVVVIKED